MAMDTERSGPSSGALVRDQRSGTSGSSAAGSRIAVVEIRDRHEAQLSQAGNSSGGGTFTSVTRLR